MASPAVQMQAVKQKGRLSVAHNLAEAAGWLLRIQTDTLR